MIKKIAQKLLSRRTKNAIHDYYREAFREGRINQDLAIPRTSLDEVNIRNCRIVLDRSAIIKEFAPSGVGAEIGVNRGEFSQIILDTARPELLHLIDVWDSERYGPQLEDLVRTKFKSQIHSGCIQIHRGLSTDIVNTFPDSYFDWIYIDSYHSYEVTRDELMAYERKMKPGGIIAGHDYEQGDWVNALRFGVIEAVHEFCVREGWELIALTAETIEYRSFAIRKIG